MKTSVMSAAVALLAITRVCLAQAPSMEAVNTTLPLEGAPKAEPGQYAVVSGPAFGTSGLRVFHPGNLDRFPKRDSLPVVVWGNGGCAVDGARYAGFLETIASHGFLVLTTAAQEGAPRRQATAEDMKAGIDWAERENQREGSPLKGKVELRKVALMGQSCGGMLSITLGADPRVGTIGVFNSGVQASNLDVLTKLHGPVLIINGHERDFAMPLSKATYEAIDKLPVFYGARHGAGHTATALHPGGGEFANVASNWVQWQFKHDKLAGRMFVGDKCRLCTNSDWDVESKRLGK
jgi:dienelactone hydrolase